MYKLILTGLAALGCISTAQADTITGIAKSLDDFKTLSTALELTGLDDLLDCDYFWCRYTAFAPTEDAFAELGDLVAKLVTPEWKEHLRRILLYHVAYGKYTSADIPTDGTIYTLAIENVNTTVMDGQVMINDAKVIIPDVEASNGVVHAIDKVLIPSFMTKDILAIAREAGNFETLLAAVDAAGLTGALQGDGPFTLFAPTDRAFQKLGPGVVDALLEDTAELARILQYHVASGIVLADQLVDIASVPTLLDGAEIEVTVYGFWILKFPYLNKDVRITVANILASNGVIHVIDSVLLPEEVAPPEPTVAEILDAELTLSTLTTALKAANLFDTLAGEGPFTVFAPDDDAFGELGEETIAALLDDAPSLAPILTYHAVAANVLKSDLESGAIETLNGAPLLASVGLFRTRINGARITYFDIKGSNGVVHVINEVLLPPEGDCLVVAKSNGLEAFVDAVEAAGLAGNITDPAAKTIFVPTNRAFEALGGASLDTATLVDVLTYHVVPAFAAASNLSNGDKLPTVQGGEIKVVFRYFLWIFFEGAFLNDDSKIVSTDLLCSNGFIHQIDKILKP